MKHPVCYSMVCHGSRVAVCRGPEVVGRILYTVEELLEILVPHPRILGPQDPWYYHRILEP